MTGRATRVGAALITALAVAASLALASTTASAQPGQRGPSELWSEYPLDPAKGETPPPVTGDEGAEVPPAGVDTVPRGEPRPVDAAPPGDGDGLLASPVLWVLLVTLLLGIALLVTALRAPWALESVTAVPARFRGHDLAAALRTPLSASARLARRAAVDVPRTFSRLAVPAGATVRLARRARRPVVTAPRRTEVPAEQGRVREETTVAETLVERTREYVALPDRAPDVDERAVAAADPAPEYVALPERRPDVDARAVAAADVERCEIRWWRGYLKAQFYAHAVTKEGLEVVVATSPMFWWRHAEPPAPTKAAVAARTALVDTLVARGWRLESAPHEADADESWFDGRFRYGVRANARARV